MGARSKSIIPSRTTAHQTLKTVLVVARNQWLKLADDSMDRLLLISFRFRPDPGWVGGGGGETLTHKGTQSKRTVMLATHKTKPAFRS
jgi:hypothetical protein